MSKERELLQTVAVRLLVFDLKKASDLVDEIQELLAQPEQEQATPRQGLAVAKILEMALYWMKELKFVYAHPDYDYEDPYLIKDINELEELLAQPEQAPVAWRYKTHNRYTYTEENYHELEGEGEPLYASPQKREHLSDNEIFNAWSPSKKSPCVYSFKAGVKFAEKAHGITGGGE